MKHIPLGFDRIEANRRNFIGKDAYPIVNSKRANDTVNLYMLVLQFPSTDLHNIFSCDNCEKILPNEGNHM